MAAPLPPWAAHPWAAEAQQRCPLGLDPDLQPGPRLSLGALRLGQLLQAGTRPATCWPEAPALAPSQGRVGLSQVPPGSSLLWLRAEFRFLFGRKGPDGNPLSCPRARVSHPFPACQVGGVTPSELAGGGGAALPWSLFPGSQLGSPGRPVIRVKLKKNMCTCVKIL